MGNEKCKMLVLVIRVFGGNKNFGGDGRRWKFFGGECRDFKKRWKCKHAEWKCWVMKNFGVDCRENVNFY